MLNNKNVLHEYDHIGIILRDKCHDRHKHFCKHIILSETPILFKFDNEKIISKGMFIQSEVYHDVDYSDTKVLIVAIEETSLFAKCLDISFLEKCDYCEIPNIIQEECYFYLINNDLKMLKDIFYKYIVNNENSTRTSENNKIDDRVEKALKIIVDSESLGKDILEKILKEVNLSKSRFSHLFKECIGISFKRYILLKRIEKTFWYSMNYDMSITEAAISAGFSSSSHFSYAFKKNYGISYSKFLNTK